MSTRPFRPFLSSVTSELSRQLRAHLNNATDETVKMVLYSVAYWFRVWDHDYNLSRSRKLNRWLKYLLEDIESNILDSKPLLVPLNYIYRGTYIKDINHFN